MKCKITVRRIAGAEEKSLKAYAEMVFDDCFVVAGVRIYEKADGTPFVQMPSYKTNQVNEDGSAIYKQYCYPITKAARERLYDAILQAYDGNGCVEIGTLTEGGMPCEVTTYPSETSGIHAYCSVVFGQCFAVNGIKVRDGKNGRFVAMPSKKAATGDYVDICHPITKEFREKMYGAVLTAAK